jgi:hypothetical protein
VDNEAIALKAIRRYVWSGMHDADEIVEILDESIFEPGQLDQDWLRAVIEEAFRQKRIEEETWPKVTDCDRLDRVFESMEDQGILALQNAGYTQSDGLSDVSQFYHEAGGEQSGIEGYCFYHGQDLERVVESGELWLAFGHVSGENEPGVEIGRRIKRAFEAAWFPVEWNGSVETRLLIRNIRWQRRGRPG